MKRLKLLKNKGYLTALIEVARHNKWSDHKLAEEIHSVIIEVEKLVILTTKLKLKI